MSVFASSVIWRHSQADGSALLIALAIADFADDDGLAWPAVSTLAKKARVSERSAQYAVQSLITRGELVVEFGSGPKGTNTYRLRLHDMIARARQTAQNNGGANSAPVQPTVGDGATGCTQTIIEPSEQEESAGARGRSTPTPPAERITFDFDAVVFRGPVCDHSGRWREAFPAIDVDAEVKRAALWLKANPANRKSNYLRFLTSWMQRAQDRAPRVAGAQQRTYGAQRNERPSRQEQRDEWLGRLTGRTTSEPDIIDIDMPA